MDELYKLFYQALLLLCLVWYGKYHWNRRAMYKMVLKIPGPLSLPIIGNALYFAVPATEIVNKLLKTMAVYKSPMRMWFGHHLAVFVWNPRDIEIVLNSPHALDKERMIYKHYDFALGCGLGTAPAKIWKRNRRLITPTFRPQNINGFISVFVKQSLVLVQQLKPEVGAGVFDCFDYINRCTLDMIFETALGVQINSQTTDSDLLKWIDQAMNIVAKKIVRIWYHVDFIFERSAMCKELHRIMGNVCDFLDRIISDWKKSFDQRTIDDIEESGKPKTFLLQLLKLSAEGACFTNKELRDEVVTFILAGSETTASTLGFMLVMLGMHPEIQESVYQEVMDVVGPSRNVESEDLPKLEYMDRVMKETTRLYPVGASIARSTTSDIKLDTCTIPAGSCIAIEIIGLHRNADIWPNPLRFDPDRFLSEEIEKRHPYSWLPFSGGPRNCIGAKYAWMSMKSILAALIKSYKFTSDYKSVEDVNLKHNVTIRAANGYRIAIESRS